jgi:hypothetical protein
MVFFFLGPNGIGTDGIWPRWLPPLGTYAPPMEERRDEFARAAVVRRRESPTKDRSAAAITTTRCQSIGSGGFREREGPKGSTKKLDMDLRRRWTPDLCRRW